MTIHKTGNKLETITSFTFIKRIPTEKNLVESWKTFVSACFEFFGI